MDQATINSSYFSRRAAEERDAAQLAEDPRARQSHLDLAERYAQAAQSAGHEGLDGELMPEARSAAVLQPEFRILP